jgi:hypothetical protein
MAEIAPHLLKNDYVEPSIFSRLAMNTNGNQELNHTVLSDRIDVSEV